MAARLVSLLTLIAFLSPTGAAQAHPHVWIEAKVILHLAGGKVTAVSQQWIFDPRFSIVLLGQFDTNRNRHFDKSEITPLRKAGFSSLERLSYFTNVRVNGKFQKITKIRYFDAEVRGSQVVYTFTVALETPVDPRAVKADFLFLDRTYYVDVDVKKAELRGGQGCTFAWQEDKKHPIYYGLVIPKMLNVSCPEG